MQSQYSPQPQVPSSERDWIDGIRNGDAAAFAAMFDAYYNRLCVYAEGYVRTRDLAEEIVQEVFVRIWARHAELEIRHSLGQYLYTSVRNQSIRHLRDVGTRERAHAVVARSARPPGMGEPAASADDELYAEEIARVVERTIARLPARRREAFVLFRQHGLSHAEIGAIMNISVSTVEQHVNKAARALRDAVERLIGKRDDDR